MNHVKDLFIATYIVLFEGFSSQKKNVVLEQWLDYDTDVETILEISLPEVPRLTYEVRQDPIFSEGGLTVGP